MTIRDELLRLIWLNEQEEWVPTHIALEQLESFGDDLIPGLMECLTDKDEDVRRLAVTLLCEARPRSNSVVPALIERLGDEDRLVRVAVLTHIGGFGPIASDAIPRLCQSLYCDDEYQRILVLTAIVSIDPTRTELLPDIEEALKSENICVRSVARDFLGKTNATLPFDDESFQEAVRGSWLYQTPCEQVRWKSEQGEDGTWKIEVAPVFQEMWGGADDGK